MIGIRSKDPIPASFLPHLRQNVSTTFPRNCDKHRCINCSIFDMILLKSVFAAQLLPLHFFQSNKHDLFLVTGIKYCYDTYQVMIHLKEHIIIFN